MLGALVGLGLLGWALLAAGPAAEPADRPARADQAEQTFQAEQVVQAGGPDRADQADQAEQTIQAGRGEPAGQVHPGDLVDPGGQALVLDVPYRSQLDGGRHALANCGPASLGMVLAYFGVDASLWDVRVRAMQAQGSWEDYSDSYGVFVHGLAATAESYGLRSEGLWRTEAGHVDALRAWQAADVRRVVREGHPVIVEVGFRWLPGRQGLRTRVDHYIVVHGLLGDQFVYSDPLDRQGGGPDRLISEPELLKAMTHASQPQAAFGVYRPRR